MWAEVMQRVKMLDRTRESCSEQSARLKGREELLNSGRERKIQKPAFRARHTRAMQGEVVGVSGREIAALLQVPREIISGPFTNAYIWVQTGNVCIVVVPNDVLVVPVPRCIRCNRKVFLGTPLSASSRHAREENHGAKYTRKALMRQLVETAKWLASCQ